jgi:hypothetical protein
MLTGESSSQSVVTILLSISTLPVHQEETTDTVSPVCFTTSQTPVPESFNLHMEKTALGGRPGLDLLL